MAQKAKHEKRQVALQKQTGLPKNLIEYASITEFLEGCKSPYTAKGYKTALNKFFKWAASEFNGFDPDTSIKMNPDELNPIVLKYAMYLKKVAKTSDDFKRGEISVNSVTFYLSPIKTFYDNYGLMLLWKKIFRYIPETVVKHYHVYNKEEIEKLLAVSNPRERIIVFILMTTGMRAEALVKLQIRDLEILPDKVGRFVVYARTRDYYHTFCTPECTAAIQFYLQWRKDMDEVEQGQELARDGPLIRDSIKDKFAKGTKTPKPIKYWRLWEIMQKLLRKANIPNDNVQPNHSFRKFMNTAIANAKISYIFKEILLGHSLKLDEVYYDRENPASIENLHQEYLRVVNYLTLGKEYILQARVTELEEQTEAKIEAAVEKKIQQILGRVDITKFRRASIEG